MRRPILSLAACIAFAACARSPAPAEAPTPEPAAVPTTVPTPPMPSATGIGVEREFRGAYTRGFEASWFAPCDAPASDALWWVTLTEDARLQRDSLLRTITSPATEALHVRWRGTVSERMRAGHMGRGTRYILVTEILEVRPLVGRGACLPMSRPA